MLPAIYFYNKSGRKADEVCDVGTDWILAAKFVAFNLSLAQTLPELSLRVGHLTTENGGVLLGFGISHPLKRPHPYPPPQAGEGVVAIRRQP